MNKPFSYYFLSSLPTTGLAVGAVLPRHTAVDRRHQALALGRDRDIGGYQCIITYLTKQDQGFSHILLGLRQQVRHALHLDDAAQSRGNL